MNQYDIYSVGSSLGPEGRPSGGKLCVVLSPGEMSRHLDTVIIAPMTTKAPLCPTRMAFSFMRKNGLIVLDQLVAVDKGILSKRVGRLDTKAVKQVKKILMEMLVE